MTLVRSFTAVLVAASVFAGPLAAQPEIVPNSYIVQVSHTADLGAVAQRVIEATGGRIGHFYTEALWGFSVQLPPGIARSAIFRSAGVIQAEEDLVMHAVAQSLPTGVDRIDAEGAAVNMEASVVNVNVAIIDTGIAQHSDLNIAGGVRFYSGVEYSSYADDNGHGTHVAGTVAAIDNDLGVVGVAPGAWLWAVKVLNANGSGYLSDIIKGIDWVTARGDIEVANMSLGAKGTSSALRTALQNGVAKGTVYVVAAGNDGMDVYGRDGKFGTRDDFIPAAYPEVATISAMVDTNGTWGGGGSASSYGADDSFASFSNYSRTVVSGNPVSSPGAAIDLILPGVNILSTYMGGGYATMSGTSMASPHAAGLAALYIAGHGRADNAGGVYAIRQALIDAGKAQTAPEGLAVQNDPDANQEKLGWAGSSMPVNLLPAASFTYLATGLTVQFTDTSTDDGSVVAWSWVFGDASTSTDQHPSHTYAAAGTYTVTLTVTDNGGATDVYSAAVNVQDGSTAGTMHIEAIAGSTTQRKAGKNVFVSAVAKVTIVDASGQPVSGATVTGQWSGVVSGAVTGITGADGLVTMTSPEVKTPPPSSQFILNITGVEHDSLVYDPADDVMSSVMVTY